MSFVDHQSETDNGLDVDQVRRNLEAAKVRLAREVPR